MSYVYQQERPKLFTEEGQELVIKALDNVRRLLADAGAFLAFRALKGVSYGDTFMAMAILDRLVEMGYIREITGPNVWGQERVFVEARK
jgi:hypothetical protein